MQGHVPGGFPVDLYAMLEGDQKLVEVITGELLESNFPPSMHEEIMQAVGLDGMRIVGGPSSRRRMRDRSFRPDVMRAYEERCAVCSLDSRLGGVSFLLEAAHIRWHNMDGPDEVANGLALCVLHHRALDRGAIGLNEDHRILVSQQVFGGSLHEETLLRFHGSPIRPPQDPALMPARDHIAWHNRQVFRGPARVL